MKTINTAGSKNTSPHSLHDVFNDIIANSPKVRWRGSDRATICCPAHDDKTPSLDVSVGDRAILLHCHAGCELQRICDGSA